MISPAQRVYQADMRSRDVLKESVLVWIKMLCVVSWIRAKFLGQNIIDHANVRYAVNNVIQRSPDPLQGRGQVLDLHSPPKIPGSILMIEYR